jgi:hypothetical protein
LTELAGAVAEYGDLYKKLYGARGGGTTGKSKVGRPSIWRSVEGWYFVCSVHNARKEKPRSIVAAIKWLKKHDPITKDWGWDVPSLQVRYQEAAQYWQWAFKPKEHRATQDALDAAHDRVRAALKAVRLSVRQSDFP